MIFRIRVILDVEEDVLRDIEIEAKSTLKNLHEAIQNLWFSRKRISIIL